MSSDFGMGTTVAKVHPTSFLAFSLQVPASDSCEGRGVQDQINQSIPLMLKLLVATFR